LSEQGGTIAGEPATADELRDLIADAHPTSTLRRLVTDANGGILDAGRTRYAVTGIQRYVLDLRDGTCRFAGCTRPARWCEIDHATAWNRGGRTDLADLGNLCKHHHQLRTHGGWDITASTGTGACTWRSPLGRIYQHTPPDLVPPAPPKREPTESAAVPPF
jgi:hypothetical protein